MARFPARSPVVLAAACLTVVMTAGCGSDTRHEVVPVQGRIRFADGTMLPAGTILLFNPSEGGSGTASGTTADDGSFTVVHSTGCDGAEVGKYAVLLRAPPGGDEQFYRSVPRDYFDGGVLSAEVADGMAPLELVVATPRPGRR